ncbi:MAG: Crp/Fnr family transcriptional regulator [Clostridiales bacterium]|nr:Crp/Fnr family transcriptional regulator [Clostridiales bacterium]
MIKYLGNIIESGILKNISKDDSVEAFKELSITARKYEAGTAVIYEDAKIDKICIVAKGFVHGEKLYAQGDLHIIQRYEENSIFALESAVSRLKTVPMDYICGEDSDIVFISINSIKKSTYYHEIMDVLVQELADDNIRKMHKIELLAEKSLRGRIMLYLGLLQKKSGSDQFHVNMNREQLAQFLCVNRSALSNELSKMKQEGIIDFKKDQFRML